MTPDALDRLAVHDHVVHVGREDVGRLVDGWRDRSAPALSEHLRLELAHAVHVGHRPGDPPPLRLDDPVPGCSCPTCLTFAAGGDREAATIAERLVHDLSCISPAVRLGAATDAVTIWAEAGVVLPSPGVLAVLAARVPGARRSSAAPTTRRRDLLPVEEARRVPILEVVARLGLGEPVGRGREVAVRCPLHEDDHPSLRLNAEAGVWYCDPCGIGGDGINLWCRVRRMSFAEAVRELCA